MPPERLLVGTPTASSWLGIKPNQFRSLAAKLDLSPDDWRTNPHYQSGPECPLWAPDLIDSLMNSPQVTAIRQAALRRQESKERKALERHRAFQRRYPDWHAALPDATEAMYALDLYANGPRCHRKQRGEIIELKAVFLELLYQSGHATNVKVVRSNKRRIPCHPCVGEDCVACRGRGSYKWWRCRYHVAFVFTVDNRLYKWYQPRDLVCWPFLVTEGEAMTPSEADATPVDLASYDTEKAKELVRYVLDAAGFQPVGTPELAQLQA